MLTEIDILRDISGRLDALALPYMLTGSMAMNYYAVPRMTRDIDMVISLPSGSVAEFVRALTPDYMIVEEAVAVAVAGDFMFNAIHEEAIIKVDFLCRKHGAFRLLEFERRQQVSIGDFKTWIVSLEDLILSKLFWARDSGSQTQRQDVINLLSSGCDIEYLRRWAIDLNVSSEINALLP
jgi:hypothetical protein